MPKLTRRVVDAAQDDPNGRDVVLWDDDLHGFGLRLRPPYGRFYIVQFRNALGRSRKMTLGRVGVLSPEEARQLARSKLADVVKGTDPAASRDAVREAMTVSELCDEYLKAEKGRIKASTLRMDRSRIDRHVRPLLGRRTVRELTPADIEKFMASVVAGKTAQKPGQKRPLGGLATGGAGVASRTVGMLGAIFQRAVRDGVIVANPVRGVKRPKDKSRKPPFAFETVRRLGEAMRAAEGDGENLTGLLAIRLLLLTGCRRMEILTLRREAVDEAARCFRFEDTKSGPQTRPIGQTALDAIKEAKLTGATPYVLKGDSKAGHFVGLPRVWARVAKRAGIRGVSLHGLRHWFASAAAEMNFSELTIAGMLGHRVKGVTARYATAPDSALLAAADRVSARLAAALDDTDAAAKVVNLKGAKRA